MRQGGHRPKVPASVANIDLDRVRRALFKADGNVSHAAKSLKVKSADLRRLTWRHPKLIMDALERVHRLIDKAEENLLKALDGDHAERALRASLFILSHNAAARERGWSRHAGSDYDDLYPRPAAAPTVVIWAGDAPGYRPLSPGVPEARASGGFPGRRTVSLILSRAVRAMMARTSESLRMARPPPPVKGPKRGILPLGGVLAQMPSPLISKMLATPSPALKQPLPPPAPMPSASSRLRATVTPPTPMAPSKQPLKVKPSRIKLKAPGGRRVLV